MASEGILRAREDIAEGRWWKARDRLNGVVQALPADQEALGLLGEVYFRMGDYPAAGRCWSLTDRTDAEAVVALKAFDEYYENAGNAEKLRVIKARAPLSEYPSVAQERLSAWAKDAKTKDGQIWNPSAKDGSWIQDKTPLGIQLLLVGIAIGTVGVWMFGVVALVYLLTNGI